MKVVVIFEFDEITDVDGTEADHAIGLINHSCNRWDTEVNASRVYIDNAYQEVEDETKH